MQYVVICTVPCFEGSSAMDEIWGKEVHVHIQKPCEGEKRLYNKMYLLLFLFARTYFMYFFIFGMEFEPTVYQLPIAKPTP